MSAHNPRCAIYNDPPSLRSAQDCNCGAIPPLPAGAERDLALEEIRVREESQIPVIPSAAQELLLRLRAERDALLREREDFGPFFIRDIARLFGLPDQATLDSLAAALKDVRDERDDAHAALREIVEFLGGYGGGQLAYVMSNVRRIARAALRATETADA